MDPELIAPLSVQVIDEQKAFHVDQVAQYLDASDVLSTGLNYHVVSVFGSQSTGKSTLLNALFGTTFNVMDESARQQTTKGIWLANADFESPSPKSDHSAGSYVDIDDQTAAAAVAGTDLSSKKPPVLVMDVEGTDGRERGEDQDFERKSALFALATSEVLIVNMWENQVGLYQGANMALLKTVFEVNLSLFHASKQQTSRSLILFVIRDHIGTTPMSNLSQTLIADLNRHWESISKPDDLSSTTIDDFFDVQFVALPHKILMPHQFNEKVGELAQRFKDPATSGYVFDSKYHRHVPVDGWNMYAAQIWEQIELNKDLDLPTQQVLVARFRCSEIAAQAVEEFESLFKTLQAETGNAFGNAKLVVPAFAAHLKQLRNTALDFYDQSASRYIKTVYLGQRKDLQAQVDSKLVALFKPQLAALHKTAIDSFHSEVKAGSKDKETSFLERIRVAEKAATSHFLSSAREVSDLDGDVFAFKTEHDAFTKDLQKEVSKLQAEEIAAITARASKRIARILGENLDSYFADPSEYMWDGMLKFFKSTVGVVLTPFRSDEGLVDFRVGASSHDNERGAAEVLKGAWITLDREIKQHTTPASVVGVLLDKFELEFKYDSEKVPVVWKQGDDIQTPFVKARDDSIALLAWFRTAKLSSGKIIEPDVKIYDDDEDEEGQFATRLTTKQVSEIEAKFNRQADLAFVEAKRSTYQSVTQIPLYMFVLVVVLGWNEFMAVLRNPLLILFALMAAGAGYITFTLNMWGPIASVSQAMSERALEIGKERLRQALEVQPQRQPIAVPASSNNDNNNNSGHRDGEEPIGESIELKPVAPFSGQIPGGF